MVANFPWAKVAAEIEKCDLLCIPCHATEHRRIEWALQENGGVGMETIATLRRQAELSQRELAEKVGVKSVSTVAGWEQGNHEPTARQLISLARLFGVNCTEIILPFDEFPSKRVKPFA